MKLDVETQSTFTLTFNEDEAYSILRVLKTTVTSEQRVGDNDAARIRNLIFYLSAQMGMAHIEAEVPIGQHI